MKNKKSIIIVIVIIIAIIADYQVVMQKSRSLGMKVEEAMTQPMVNIGDVIN